MNNYYVFNIFKYFFYSYVSHYREYKLYTQNTIFLKDISFKGTRALAW